MRAPPPPTRRPLSELFPAAFISEGPELDRALKAMGLKPPRPMFGRFILFGLIGWGILVAAFGALSFALWALERVAR